MRGRYRLPLFIVSPARLSEETATSARSALSGRSGLRLEPGEADFLDISAMLSCAARDVGLASAPAEVVAPTVRRVTTRIAVGPADTTAIYIVAGDVTTHA